MSDDSKLEYEDGAEPNEQTTAEPDIVAGSEGSDLPIKEGAIYGVATFLLGYVITYATTSALLTATAAELESADPGSWKVAGWVFLNYQGVEMQVGGDAASLSGALLTANVPADMFTVMFPAVMFLLPMAFLAAGGYSLANSVDDGALEDKLKAAVTLVPGYLALALVTTLAVGHEYDDGSVGEIALATQDAILYAGILWPVVFGVIGALLATWPKPVDRIMAQLD